MKPIVLAILDGVGIRKEEHGNAFKQAYTPIYNNLIKKYPHSELLASGEAVGLPQGQMGNSEVGHLNIGAGRIVYQPLEIINKAIKDKSIFTNKKILNVIKHVKEEKSKLHILGLLSDGGVHSHIDHLIAILEIAKKEDLKQVYFHIFTDGRDTSPTSAKVYLEKLLQAIKEQGLGKISTISGRYYAMDRDKRWERTKLAYDALVLGKGEEYQESLEVIDQSYQKGIFDEFILPSVIDKTGIIQDHDGLIFANFRPDRATQILTALTNLSFKDFEIKKLKNIKLVTLMPGAGSIIGDSAYKMDNIKNSLGVYLSTLSFNQLRIAETEKYAHVTYFFDGGKERVLEGCTRILIPSPKVKTYDLKPEMSIYEVTDKLLEEIKTNKYDLIILNYANPDMVGHTGNLEKTIQAIEAVDENLGRIYKKIKEKEGLLIVTADHGNCEYMLDDKDRVITSHTTNKVPFIICDKGYQVKDGKLGDIAPTILKLMKIEIPKEMTGEVLIEEEI
ncbi:MAG: 2,3-bisphosphoglycerate-independent phosphoglycerate mutase [Bacilli bacterium]|jgi:2,3-bisphosphoglycerate-independent phosphoglycerate mutase